MLHLPSDGGCPRLTRSTRSPSRITAPTPTRGASGYSRAKVIGAPSPCPLPLRGRGYRELSPLGGEGRVRGYRVRGRHGHRPTGSRPAIGAILLMDERLRERHLLRHQPAG